MGCKVNASHSEQGLHDTQVALDVGLADGGHFKVGFPAGLLEFQVRRALLVNLCQPRLVNVPACMHKLKLSFRPMYSSSMPAVSTCAGHAGQTAELSALHPGPAALRTSRR